MCAVDAITTVETYEHTTAVRHYDPVIKARAYELYLHSGGDMTDIALQLQVPRNVVAKWACDGKWSKRKEILALEIMKAAEFKYRDFMLTNRMGTVERHVRIGAKLEEAVEKLLQKLEDNQSVSSTEVRRLADALSSVAAVTARASAKLSGSSAIAMPRAAGPDTRAPSRRPLRDPECESPSPAPPASQGLRWRGQAMSSGLPRIGSSSMHRTSQ